ncbi:endo-1,4-beta-xylanase [Acidisphaera sp. L21]|uniref:endo-1,4-beta-xylanase n=1 Tax=Acidisphaera sp. L21 TaxID=1641851 RepID=UPI0020B15DEC|nr:endo-1,4-beta-xylanase [Acidisphaera sp. L21]
MIVKQPRVARPGSRLASRREVIAATLAGMGLFPTGANAAAPPPARQISTAPPLPTLPHAATSTAPAPGPVISSAGPGLGEIAAKHGRVYGAAIQSHLLAKDPVYAASVTNECGLLMPDYETKMGVLQAKEGTFNFKPLDTLLNWARLHNRPVRGHALVWHLDMPDWVEKALAEGAERAKGILDTHITRVLSHTQGSIHDWDVVNEVVADPSGSDTPQTTPGELRDSPWLKALGPDYIPMALRLAKERDRNVRVALNEYGVEEAAPHHFEKRRRMLNLVRSLRKAGVPLDAVGLQGHLQMVQPFNAQYFTQFCRLLGNEGVELVVTEMDVREHWKIPDGFAARDKLVADRVKSFVDAALEGGVKTFITWGIQDNYSWLATNPFVKRQDGLEHRGLPLDDDGHRTLYWQAMATEFARS